MGLSSYCLPESTTFVVTGSNLRAEEMDRPLAYCLSEKISERLNDIGIAAPVYVVSDFRYLHERQWQGFPAISIGGPGVNAVAQEWMRSLPVALELEDEFFLQMGTSKAGVPRASIWGMDHATTQSALATFLDHYLGEFLGIPAQHSSKRA